MRKIFVAIFFTLLCLSATGQVLETLAPATVPTGRQFNVEYRIEVQGGQIAMPDFRGFDLIAGPALASSSSITMENGKTTTTHSTSYVFTLVGRQAGVFTIPAATVTVDNKSFTSKSKQIEVVDEEATSSATNGTGRLSGEEIFLRAVPDRAAVWRGEPVKVQFKLYTRNPEFRTEGAKMPALNGFWAEQLDVSSYRGQTENYNSTVYYTFVVGEYLLFPLQSGVLKIDPLQINLRVRQVRQSRERTMEEMLFGGPDVVETRHSVASPVVNITVKELPGGAPSSFAGAVGDFKMTAAAPTSELVANAGATYRLTIAGTGNFHQISAPQIALPASFEALNTKTIDETRPTAKGMAGSKQFEYPMIARGEGSYRIEPVEFSYFDPQRAAYQTLTVPEVRLEVLADTLSGGNTATIMGGVTQRELEVLNRDIRFIKHDAPGLHKQGRGFALSLEWFVFAVALILAAVFLYSFLRKHLSLRRDAVTMRGRRANKVVHARLRVAGGYLEEDNNRRFYDEMLKALWGYMGDKLNIPAANLTKESIRERLLAREVSNDLITRYTGLISECESAQYSPMESTLAKDVYREAADVISKIEGYFR